MKAEFLNAETIQRIAIETLGPAPVRVGQAPKRLLMFRTAEPFGRMRLWFTVGEKQHLVEVLTGHPHDGLTQPTTAIACDQAERHAGLLYGKDEVLAIPRPVAQQELRAFARPSPRVRVVAFVLGVAVMWVAALLGVGGSVMTVPLLLPGSARTRLVRAGALAAALALPLVASTAAAQAFPNKPVKMLIGYGPGSSTDVIGRIVAQGLADLWKQPVVVENRAGAGGLVGAQSVLGSVETVNGGIDLDSRCHRHINWLGFLCSRHRPGSLVCL